MDKNVYSIEEIFAGRIFSIPDYQRGYAWEKEHCLDLLDDLDQLPPGFNHYTGTVVFHAKGEELLDNEGSKYHGFDIVDGQQRLTSLVILLDSVHKSFSSLTGYGTLASGIEKKYIKGIRLVDKTPFQKLTLNADCSNYFRTDILGAGGITGPMIRSHKRLHVAKETFAEYLSEKRTALGEEYANWLIEFYNKIVQRLKVGIYEVDSAAEVGVIFEVMNNRGKDLTELEKVKNYLLYLTTKIDISTATELGVLINKTWTNIYERFMSANLGTESENQFLRAHWLFYVDYNRKEWDGSKSVKYHFNLKAFHGRHIEFLRQLNAYVSSLDDASIAFADLEKPERNGAFNSCVDADARRRIVFHSTKLLRTRTIASFRSVLMACRLRFSDDHLLYLDLVKLLEKFAFRVYNMEGKRADTGQSSLLKAAYELYNGMRDYDQLVFHIRSLLHIYCPQERFNIFWNFDPLDNNWYYWGPLKYLLYEYEEYLADGDPLNVSWNYFGDKVLENSIEHILPQTSENTDGYWARNFTFEEINVYTHDLGNLCLTYNNGSYRNFGFDRKKGTPGQADPCYANSSLNQERCLTEFEEWNVSSILQRRAKITEWALKRWYVDLNEFQINHVSAELVEDGSEDPVIS